MFLNGYGGFVSPAGMGVLAGGIVAAVASMSVLCVGLVVLLVIGKWFTYRKMGIPGWKSIIPFYNDYALADRVSDDGIAAWFVICDAVCCVASVLLDDAHAGSAASALLGLLTLVSGIAVIVLTCVVYHRVAQGFGHNDGYTVGLVLLPVVFFPILGFSDHESFDGTLVSPDGGERPDASQSQSGQRQGDGGAGQD